MFNSNSVVYGEFCYASHDLFGCIGIRNGAHCILNTPYPKDEYRRLTAKIIEHMKETGEWGEFFPSDHSPFAYNESIASEYMPLTQQEVLDRGLRWKEVVGDPAQAAATRDLPPASILDADETTLQAIYRCQDTGRPFRILASEFAFFSERQLALPTTSPLARHRKRLLLREGRSLSRTKCGDCGVELETGRQHQGRSVLCSGCFDRTTR